MLKANEEALNRLMSSDPILFDCRTASEVVPNMEKHVFLHAGPPITYENMCAPMQGAVLCGVMLEGFAETTEEAEAYVASGKIEFRPCHEYGMVGPMTGVTTASMAVWVLKDRSTNQEAYSNISEGNGVGIRFGEHDKKTLDRLVWIRDVAAPMFSKIIKELDGIELGPIMSQGLAMGDELHMRNHATTSVFLKLVSPYIAKYAGSDTEDIISLIAVGNDQFFLNLAMAANKLAADAADGVEGSTLITAIARNGVEVGIRISGLPGRWFTAPAPMIDGLYFPGFTEEDANPDLGDSAIMEVGGFGGCSMVTAPAIVKFLGAESVQLAFDTTDQMYDITLGEHPRYQIPILNFRGVPCGIDCMEVVEKGVSPVLNTAIASNKPGGGMVGAGMATVPLAPFEAALIALAEELNL